MKYNNFDKLVLISKYNLDLVSQIINNQYKKSKRIKCNFFNGNLEIFLINKKNKKKDSYGFILEDLSDISLEFNKALNNEIVNFENF